MESIFHPVSGETGFFITEQEKNVIDAIVSDFNNQRLLYDASHDERGDAQC